MRYATVVILCLLALATRAQGVITFESTDHNFGKIAEGTMATHEYKFKNTGNQPIVIANAQASCGCTTPAWTKTPILPGQTGMVKAVYNSNGHPGVFTKTVTVMSNASEGSKVLTLKGAVMTKDEYRATLTPAELAASPRLVLERSSYDFGRVEVGQQPTARLAVKNTGPKDLVLTTLTSGCYCVGFRATPPPIKPGQSAIIELIYTQRTIGPDTQTVTIGSNDMHGDTKLLLKANVVKELAPTSLVKESGSSVPFK